MRAYHAVSCSALLQAAPTYSSPIAGCCICSCRPHVSEHIEKRTHVHWLGTTRGMGLVPTSTHRVCSTVPLGFPMAENSDQLARWRSFGCCLQQIIQCQVLQCRVAFANGDRNYLPPIPTLVIHCSQVATRGCTKTKQVGFCLHENVRAGTATDAHPAGAPLRLSHR
eukprot:SAG31_NODE_125_length_23649_cov_7.156202_12_plen_167_part_00